MKKKTLRALAIGCHPDDIEFMMSGTLFLLKEQGAELFYMNVADGGCGTQEYSTEEICAIRKEEAKKASSYLGAAWFKSIAHDMEVVFDMKLVRKVAAVMREVDPSIILAPSLYDYMEDHMNTARIVSTAAFTIGMPNFVTDPVRPILHREIALYHALPYGLQDAYQRPVIPHFLVDVSSVMKRKTAMLSLHDSQRNWLDSSQKIDSYVETMQNMCHEVGSIYSHQYQFAEGWIRHNPLGYSNPQYKPLEKALRGSWEQVH